MAAGTVYLTGAGRGRRVIPGRPRPLPDLTPGEVARFYASMIAAGHGMVWGGETNNGGYGRFPIWRGGTRIRLLAHRVSFKLATGKDPGQLVIRHRCDTPPCCTPDCFLVGTQADNVRDAIIRRRINVDGLSAYRAVRAAQTVARTGADRKLCTWCGQVKDLADFEPAPQSPDGRAYWCRMCTADHQFAPGRVTASVRLCLVTGKLPRPFDRGPLAADPWATGPPLSAVTAGRTS
jgi:HNH endonuclease